MSPSVIRLQLILNQFAVMYIARVCGAIWRGGKNASRSGLAQTNDETTTAKLILCGA